jgi:multiple sugar transport system substrate-binding protein
MTKGPDTWDDIRVGGRKIKQQFGNPVGIGLSQELDTSMAMRAIMYSFGSSEQDRDGNVVINSKQTLEAVKFVKALYEEAMTDEVFSWDPSSNNRAMLAGKLSVALNAISITRTAEKENPEMSKKIYVIKTAKGPVRRIGLEHVMPCYAIWKFAENKEGAKKFLVDYIGNFKKAFLASEFYDFPCFPKTLPDLQQQIANDPKAHPPDKYKVLGDVLDWATNVGYPGYSNAAIDEIFTTWVIPNMFAKAAKGVLSPEDAIREAESACKRIFAKWKEKGLV